MKRRWGKTAYPFVLKTSERPDTYEGQVLTSNDGWVEFTLREWGWYCEVESPGEGYSSEGDRTVIQAARDTEATRAVLDLTSKALRAGWFPPGKRQAIEEQLAAAKRATDEGKL